MSTTEITDRDVHLDTHATEDDLQRIWSWNRSVPDTCSGLVHDLISSIAQQQPDAPAVDAWDGKFTFGQLDAYASRLARNLIGSGVRPRSIIPIYFEKSKWTPVAMLAVIKAGCAAIALDENLPHQRLESIVQQAEPEVVISSKKNRSSASLLSNARVIAIHDMYLPSSDENRLLPEVSPLDTVYISFTSGTTGQPKGASMNHTNIRSAVHHQSRLLGFHQNSRVIDFAPYSFDVAWSNFFHTLCAGGCLCIPAETDMLEDLSAAMTSFNATLINITPTVLLTVDSAPSSLQSILLSGEMPYRENITRFASQVRLINTYGPTECTFKSAFLHLESSREERPSIGVGVGCCTWVVDPDDGDLLMSPGSVGELYIEGPLVGQGYLHDSSNTAQAFVTNPPWLPPSESDHAPRKGRLYRTGDLVRQDPIDGCLTFIGRKDSSQFKIRGQRVEIGDVEHHVRTCLLDRLRVIADVIQPVNVKNHTLALFIQTENETLEDIKEVLNDLRTRLPEALPAFMIPSIYLPVDKIPLGSTGKVDRRYLRNTANTSTWEQLLIMQSSIVSRSEFTEPTNDIEIDLRLLWAEALNLNITEISTLDNFLRLGGDSVSAIRMIASARKKHLRISFADILQTQCLQDLAKKTIRLETTAAGDDKPITAFSLLEGHQTIEDVRTEISKLCGVRPGNVEDVFPCTPLQLGMLSITTRRSGDYVMKTAYRLPADIDIARLKQAWALVVSKASLLRTRIVNSSTHGLVQVVIGSPSPADLYSYREALDFEEPMGLGTALCRAGLFEYDKFYVFAIEMHHAIYDGWSRALITDAMEEAYSTGQIKQTFAPFQPFVRNVLKVSQSEDTSAFWKKQLENCDATIFPHPQPRPGTKIDITHTVSDLQWPRNGTTASSTVRTALTLLLATYTNSNDVIFGATGSGRQTSVYGIERVAGPTIATTPVRVILDWSQTVADLQAQVQRQTFAIGEHEQFGLHRIQRIVDDGNSGAGQFQLLLVVQSSVEGNVKDSTRIFSQPDSTFHESEPGRTTNSIGIFNPYGMMIIASPQASGLVLDVNFDTCALKPRECQRFLRQLEQLIRQLCSDRFTTTMLKDVEIATPEDIAEVSKWNANCFTQTATNDLTIDLIDDKATSQPEALAVEAWDGRLTYQQVASMSKIFARDLIRNGVSKGDVIPICLEKSVWMSVSMLSVLRAGAIALPLPGNTSESRAAGIVGVTKSKLAISRDDVKKVSPFSGLLQTMSPPNLDNSTENTTYTQEDLPKMDTGDGALLIFTSGSTGNPKGILWNHSTVFSNVRAAIDMFMISTETRMFQFAGHDFDVHSIETFSSLAAGGCLCVPKEEDRTNRLASAIDDSHANWIQLTPSVADALDPLDLPNLRTIVTAGENLRKPSAVRWTRVVDKVYNWYGPAEASCATHELVVEEDWESGRIGKSTHGSVWLVDPKDYNILSPIGAVAEICIEGPIVSSGYIGDVEENAFVHPRWLSERSSNEEGRVYRTGDIAKYDEDGRIIILGRKEEAFRKLRGQQCRIDDIEHHAQAFLTIALGAKAVAEIFTPADGDAEILAFFVSPPEGDDQAASEFVKNVLPIDTLEAKLMELLPPHMIPRLYVPLVQIPIGNTGKVDRRYLRRLGHSLTKGQLADMQPVRHETRKSETPTEKILQKLWATIIGVDEEKISASSNFFRLGGDSIGAMRLVALARTRGLQLTSAQIFETPELSQLAEIAHQDSGSALEVVPPFALLKDELDELRARSYAADVCQVKEVQVLDVYPCTRLQEGLLAMTEKNPGRYVSRSVLALQNGIDTTRFIDVWAATVEKLAILRTRIIDIPQQGLVQVVLDKLPMRFGKNVSTYIVSDEAEHMGLGTELCRAALVDRNFILTIHHSIYDGITLRLVLQEIEDKYVGKFGITATPFQNFIQHVVNIDSRDAAVFWKEQLSNPALQQFPPLPTPAYQPKANALVERSISLEWPRNGMTASTVIRSAWSMLAARHLGSRDVIFGAVSTGRQTNVPGIEKCVGPTVTTLPVAVSIDWNESVKDFQGRLQSQIVKMTSFEQFGLQNIRTAVGGRQAEFQTLLVIQPISEGRSLQEDGPLFKARKFASNIDTQGTDPFNIYALEVTCWLTRTGLNLAMSFDSAVIEKVHMNAIVAQFETTLRQLCVETNGDMRLEDVPSASSEDVELCWIQNAMTSEQSPTLIHDKLKSSTTSQPDKIAFSYSSYECSYREMDDLSTRLAHSLIKSGVKPGDVVALAKRYTKTIPITVVALLKVGAVILPLDHDLSTIDMSKILETSGAMLAMVSEDDRKHFERFIPCHTPEQLLDQSDVDNTLSLQPVEIVDSAAVLILTDQEEVVQRFCWNQRALAANVAVFGDAAQLNESSRVYQFQRLDSYIGIVQMLATLSRGGQLCIPNESERINEAAARLQRDRCNFICITPTMSRTLDPGTLSGLSTMMFTGENLTQDVVNRWTSGRRIINCYYNARYPAATFCNANESSWHNGMIGRCSPKLSIPIWILDPTNPNLLAAHGSIGEIAFEEPKNTSTTQVADKMIENPRFLLHGHRPKFPGRRGRLHRTGDLAKLDHTNNLIYLGKQNNPWMIQEKHVVVDEVESHVRRLFPESSNIEVIVSIVTSIDGQHRLLVAFVLFPSAEIDLNEIYRVSELMEESLEGVLPDHAVPSTLVPIDSIPLTTNGILDRPQLQEIYAAHSREASSLDRTLPRSILYKARHEINAHSDFNIIRHQDENSDEQLVEPFTLLIEGQTVTQVRQHAALLSDVGEDDIEDVYPCTQLQIGLLSLTIKQPGDYTGLDVLTLAPATDVIRFQGAWERVVMASPILRTCIVDIPGQGLMQVVNRALPSWSKATSVDGFLKENEQHPIRLGSPLVRYGLFASTEKGTGPYKFALITHHSAYDGITNALLRETLQEQYYTGCSQPLIPYQNFMKYMREMDQDAETAFWKAQFEGLEAQQFPTLPSEGYQPKADSSRAQTIEVNWRKDGFTPATIIRAAWSILCAKYTDSSDVVFGSIVSGRQAPLENIERVAGPTITALPIRVRLDYGRNLENFLEAVQIQSIETISFEQTGLSRIRRISDESRQACQFQSMIVVQPQPVDVAESSLFVSASPEEDRKRRSGEYAAGFNSYALLALCTIGKDDLRVELSFDSNVIKQEVIEHMMEQFGKAVTQLCSSSLECLVMNVNLLTDKDIQSICRWNHEIPKSNDVCVHDLISQVVRSQPQSTAISAWDGDLTYDQLERASDLIASDLVNKGVNPSEVIPICFEKSVWTPVAFLAVIKAGCAILMLDTSQPEARLQIMVEQAHARTILSSSINRELASRLAEVVIEIVPETVKARLVGEADKPTTQRPLPTVQPSNLLYVVFTSGSTGVPKGCMITHQNFSSALLHQKDILRLDHTSRMYEFSSYSFDAAHWSSLHTLTAGGTLCIPSEDERRSQLSESIRRFGATDVDLTPAVARMIDFSKIPTLLNVYLGGEKVSKDDVAPLIPRIKPFIIYGPTECSATSTIAGVNESIIDNLTLGTGTGLLTWIVDPVSNASLSPVGTIGELWLEGPLVGQGYLDDPQRTALSFIQTPEWIKNKRQGDGNHLLYKTGDLVRQSPIDGTISFVGRKDSQVKLHGQRLELSEVDHHVRRCMSDYGLEIHELASEVVTPRVTGRPALVTFVQLGSSEGDIPPPWANSVHSAMEVSVPSYMIPSAYVFVDSILLTTAGKIDRKQLQNLGIDLTLEQLTASSGYSKGAAPTTESEQNLQRLWSVVLGIPLEKIGTHSNFFRMSGDSISAMQMAGLARQQGVSLTVMDILKKPRLVDMAATTEPIRDGPQNEHHLIRPFSLLFRPEEKDKTIRLVAGSCQITTFEVEDIFPCTAVQKSLLAFTTKRPGDYIARVSLELQDDVDLPRLKHAWEYVSRSAAPILRNRIANVPTEGMIQVQVGVPVQWTSYRTVDEYLKHDERKSMALSEPLTRLAFINGKGPGQKRCILTQHHAIYDGASFDLLLREVSKAYVGKVDTSPVAPFQAFLSHIERTDMAKSRDFWARQFLGSEAVPFPTLPSPDYQPSANSTVHRDISGLTWSSQNVTPSTMIRAAWAALSSRYLDSDDIVFGALVTGRQAPVVGIERMIAPLIAALPVRVKFATNQTVNQLLSQMQEQAVEMIPFEHTDLPDIRKINRDTATGAHFNTLLIVQPPRQTLSQDLADGPFSRWESVGASTKGLDNFNPHAAMIMCTLEGNSGLHFEVSFDSHVLSVAQMEFVAAQFEHVLRQICVNTKQPVEELSVVSPEDVSQLWAWNSSVPETLEMCVHDMISKTVVQQPQTPAICSWDGNLSYQELEDLTTRFASQLHRLGVGRGDIVPLCFEKSMWHPIAALATIKAGAASVSMDATQPEGRLRSIVQQLSPKFVLSSAANEQLAARISGPEVTVIVADKMNVPAEALCDLPPVSPSDVLYIVFTSGSTGVPKGIVTTHTNFSTATLHQADMINVKSGMRVFDFVSYSFDVAWSNLLNTFIQGACLCIPSETERKNDIVRTLNRFEADYVYFTPSVARSLDPKSMPGLRTLAMGGEPISSAEVARWTQCTTIVGLFGPAECAQALSIVHLTSKSRNNHVGYAYGANKWLVRPGNPDQLAAIGTVGELIIEGPTVAQYYWNDPQKTEAAFIKCPRWLSNGTSEHPGRRHPLYKTGDLLRQNTDGSMEFVGRKDGLIKLRGQRIELSEVEYHVRANVQDATLYDALAAEIIKPRNSDQPILAIFFGISAGDPHRPSQSILQKLGKILEGLENKLEQQLPQYMVPGAYIPLEKIPMTTTNKTDRRRLREIGSEQRLESLAELQSQGAKRQAPTTAMEKQLQQLWSTVLGIDAASIESTSSFLRIGGESISAMRLVAAARQQQLSLTVADIFKHPRLNQLAKVVKQVKAAKEPEFVRTPFSLLPTMDVETFFEEYVEPVVDADLDEVEDILPVTDFQQTAVREALQDLPGRYPHWIIDLPEDVDVLKLKRSCKKLVDQFDILRTVFVAVEGRYWQVILKSFRPMFDVVESDDEDENVSEFVNAICKKDLKRERSLGRAFLRFIAVKHPSGQHKLIIRISHAQFDGYSFGTVLDTLSDLYDGKKPVRAASFANVIALNYQKKAASLKHWSARLEGEEVTFPTWSGALPSKTKLHPEERLNIELGIPIPKSQQCPDIPTATLFHAACILVLSQKFSQQEIILGRLVTGRSMLPTDLQAVVGPCLTEVPIRHRVEAEDTIASIATKLQEQFIEDSKFESAGMREIIAGCTNWDVEREDCFGWRTAFQQEEEGEDEGEGGEKADSGAKFLGEARKVSFYERDEPPRHRPEIYATPKKGGLVLMFEGNGRGIEEEEARDVLERLGKVLGDC